VTAATDTPYTPRTSGYLVTAATDTPYTPRTSGYLVTAATDTPYTPRTSGYLVTAATQAAPDTVPTIHRSSVANICSVSFQAALASALILAFFSRPVLFPDE